MHRTTDWRHSRYAVLVAHHLHGSAIVSHTSKSSLQPSHLPLLPAVLLATRVGVQDGHMPSTLEPPSPLDWPGPAMSFYQWRRCAR